MSNQSRRTRTKRVDFTFHVIQLLSTIAFQGEISHPNTLRKLPGEARLRSSLKAHASQVSRYAISHSTALAWLSLSVVLMNGSGHAGGRRDRGPRGYSTRSMMILSWLLVTIKGTATSSLTVVSVDSSRSRFAPHESMQYISLLSARPSGRLPLHHSPTLTYSAVEF
jgi:hypothetical protein